MTAKQNQNSVDIIPLGGMEEVGRNSTVFRYKEDIVVVDLGLQFPEEDMPGVDYIIPNISYLKKHKDKIQGVFITHAHYDHIGALPHVMEDLDYPTIYTSKLTKGIIKRRFEDYSASSPDFEVVEGRDKVQLGAFELEFFHVNHNIPDTLGVNIRTPVGNIVHTSDFKFDRNPILEEPTDASKLAEFGREGVLCLLSDSTNAEKEGFSTSETEIKANLDNIFQHSPEKRIIVGTFSSLITRIQQIFDLAEEYGRKVAIDGYSMKANVEIAQELGYLKFHRGTRVSMQEASNMDSENVVVICTGAQGEGNASLMRIAQEEHHHISFSDNDVVVFSSSIVPGNERTVQSLKDLIFRQGAKVIDYQMMDIHAGGHAKSEDLKMTVNLTKPKYFIPIQGNYYMLRMHADMVKEMGWSDDQVALLGNGDKARINEEKMEVTKEHVPSSYVFVDGLGVGDVGNIVLRDRQKMSEDGMFVLIARIDSETGELYGPAEEIDIISRGFVYLNESKDLLRDARKKIDNIIAKKATEDQTTNWSYLKDMLRDKVGQFLFQETQRRPMVLPVIIEV